MAPNMIAIDLLIDSNHWVESQLKESILYIVAYTRAHAHTHTHWHRYYIVKALDVLDPTWTMACERADTAGRLLAGTLLSRPHGSRPVRTCVCVCMCVCVCVCVCVGSGRNSE